ncbi:MAG: ferritin-like domain-containing protein [Chloroflexi bacterium]|nr:ferritin-like domain-containing protein [Chloroflexota bacterium]
MDNVEILRTWLNDAYSVETNLTHVLDSHAKAAKDFPDIQAKLREHLEQTRRHAELVGTRVAALGGETHARKEGMAAILAPVQALLTGAVDEAAVLKNSVSDYAAENFEIATYRALIVAAQDRGDTETAQVCQQILADEEEMATWLDRRMPGLVDRIVRSALTS